VIRLDDTCSSWSKLDLLLLRSNMEPLRSLHDGNKSGHPSNHHLSGSFLRNDLEACISNEEDFHDSPSDPRDGSSCHARDS